MVSLAVVFGCACGAYSSIFLAAPLLLALQRQGPLIRCRARRIRTGRLTPPS
jgi:preprotein translocase subunit SecF